MSSARKESPIEFDGIVSKKDLEVLLNLLKTKYAPKLFNLINTYIDNATINLTKHTVEEISKKIKSDALYADILADSVQLDMEDIADESIISIINSYIDK